jgi:hypothetical protein
VLPDGLPDAMIRKILVENPLEAYPRLRPDNGASGLEHSDSAAYLDRGRM